MTQEELQFTSGDGRCAATLYRPGTADGLTAAVVMAHGFVGTREEGLRPYAEAFADAGAAVLLFDYRHFGDSPGEPRQLLDIAKQHEDYRAAIAHARSLPGIDPERIVLWGSSFSGGHVVAVAAADPRIAAVISQAPFTNGPAALRLATPKNMLLSTIAGLKDQAGALVGRPPVLIPAVGAPGTFAVMTAPEAEPGYLGIVDEGSRWHNEVAARVMLRLGTYRPDAKAPTLKMPLLVCVCDRDQTTPPAPALRMAERAPLGEIRTYPLGHFEIYTHAAARADQVEFLQRHVIARQALSVA